MRPVSRFAAPRRFAVLRLAVFAFATVVWGHRPAVAQSLEEAMQAGHAHDTDEWTEISAHLPDPAAAPAEKLIVAGDVLRARRFQGDALRFYNAALLRGADQGLVLKKMGITCLEMQQPGLAHLLFARAVRLDKRDAVAWNDLAATDMAVGNPYSSLREYRRAIKFNRTNAVFHANLALAYFEVHSADSARHELQTALRLDPEVLHRTGSSGFSAQVLSAEHYGEVCLEMAHLAAQRKDQIQMLDWLTKAGERGVNLQVAMGRDEVLRPFLADPEVQVMLRNRQELRAGNHAPADVPSLGAAPAPAGTVTTAQR